MNPVDGVCMRDLHGGYHDLAAHRASNGVLVIATRGFGHLVAGLIDVPGTGTTLSASLVQTRRGGNTVTFHRAAKNIDGRWEVELLPNPSSEDRLVVCIPTDILEHPTAATDTGASHG
jgi:hypothetical protein